MQSPVFVHVGLAKCASSTLQAFFRDHPDIFVVDPRRAKRILAHPPVFQFDEEAAGEFFRAEVAQAQSQQQVPVLSHERFAGSAHAGHYDVVQIAQRFQHFNISTFQQGVTRRPR